VLSAKCNARSKQILGSAGALPSRKVIYQSLIAIRYSLFTIRYSPFATRRRFGSAGASPSQFIPSTTRSKFQQIFSPQRHFLLLELTSKWTEVKNDFCFQFLRRILWRSPHERASEPSAVMELRFCYYLPAQSCQPESWLWRQSVIDHQAT
jgi:hypothetical protein